MTERKKWKSVIEKIEHVCEGKYDSFWSMVMIFFTMSLTGWLWEVCLHLVSDGSFVNRGFLHGPWLPIYGSGSVLILTLLNRLRKKPLLEFLAIILLCGCIEYYISWFLEQVYGGMVIVYFYAPLLDHLFRRIPKKILAPVCLVLILIFCTDLIYSGKNPNLGNGIARCH